MSCYTVNDILTNAEEPTLETAYLQHFFSIKILKNSHSFLLFLCLNFVKMLKFEKVIEI